MSERSSVASAVGGNRSPHRAHKEPESARSKMLLPIENLLDATPILFLEGPDGTGKTTLLRQFKRDHASNTIALFVSAASRWSYDPSKTLAELCDEIENVLNVRAPDTTDERRFARLLRLAA